VSRPSPRRPGAGIIINLAIIVIGLIGIGGLLLVGLVSDDEDVPGRPIELSLQLQPVADGFESPVLLVGAGDGSGHRFVVEQRGRILRLRPDGAVEAEPFLDITDRVLHHHERGLLGLAFHPGYTENGRFFVTYSRRDDGATSISEFTVSAGRIEAPPTEPTERALLTIPQPFTTHKAGMLAFDHEGMLLVGIGDGGYGNDPLGSGQDRASLLGKLLRLDVDRGWPYATPTDNGFANDPEARPEVHAIGLRNPWRFSVDRDGGYIYIGDVGQGGWEEIDVLPPGAREPSFGWSEMEGRECFGGKPCRPQDHVPPAVAYAHAAADGGHCSVIGGYAYRGTAGSLPDGAYLYADYCSGTIWAVPAIGLRAGEALPAVVGQVPPGHGQALSFGEDDAGELYLLTSTGTVFSIDTAGPASEPA
jgi:glucose/arabinose dehydrogenase